MLRQCRTASQIQIFISTITQTLSSSWATGAIFNIKVEIIKDIPDEQCWQLILQYNHPIDISSVWNDGRLAKENKQSKLLLHSVEKLRTHRP